MKDWTHQGACPSIIINNQRELTIEQYQLVLQRLHDIVESGQKLVLDDSDEIGAKHTHCSWGLCTDNREVYDNPRMHTFPADFIKYGRMSPLTPPDGYPCPFDDRARKHPRDDPAKSWGCFYRCRIFQGRVSREEALELIEEVL